MDKIRVGIKGAGDIASGIACRLHMANIREIFMMELPRPTAVRRRVAFSEAAYDGQQVIEDVRARLAESPEGIVAAWSEGDIAVVVDPLWEMVGNMRPDVVIDAMLLKRNIGTRIDEAPLVIGLGPGFCAGLDVHIVVETNRGHDLGRIILTGSAEPDTGIPGTVLGRAAERVLRSPAAGVFNSNRTIGDRVEKGDTVGTVASYPVRAQISGLLRGLIRTGCTVSEGLKVGDVDPRPSGVRMDSISDKARGISGSVLEAIMRKYHGPRR